ncbi:hypothetical protein BGW39_004967 [Mortierella sp. 14UC]|nr:hypothetical protein BGW39_004967 [Mortierella sp. 14UC]
MCRARVKWETPKTVMIVTKPGDESLLKITREIALWMIASRGLTVFVDQQFKENPKFKYPSFLLSKKHKYDYTHSLKFWNADLCAQEAHLFDFAITLGGDGTVLFTSWLFQRIVPPILPFSAGSLGFLTPFPTIDYQQILGTCLDHGVRVNLRMRFSCTIYRCLEHRAVDKSKKKKRKGSRRRSKNSTPDHNADDSDDSDADRRALPTVLTTPTETFEILNDLVLDRGPSANLSLLELFGDEEHLTTVQADGIVISTPTGSTAYSLAAGGPLTHPEIPAILISPICPHTLSFRPMLLPDSMELRICVPFDSRSTAWASFDGRGRVELKQGDHIKVTASVYPFPTICSSTQSSDWFHSLSRCLRWNERERQKGFTVVEHSRPKRNRQASSSMLSPPGGRQSAGPGEGHQTPTAGAPTGVGNHLYMQGGTASNPNIDNSSSLPPMFPQHQAQGQSQEAHHVSGNSSASSSRVRLPYLRSGVTSPAVRKTSNGGQATEYFDHSPQDTDTMLTCWGTDTSESDEDDDEDSDVGCQEKECAEDGDGEWEEGTSSEDDDDDDVVGSTAAARREAGLKGGGDLDRASLSMSDLTNGAGPIKALSHKMQRAAIGSNSSATGTGSGTDGTERGPTVVPQYLLERYNNTFYGSGDLHKECLDSYNDCCAQLEGLIGFRAERARGGEIVIMSGEGMVGLWGGLKSVIPWPFQYSKETGKLVAESEERKFRVLTVGNGVYGCGMLDMVVGLRYPNVEVKAVDSAWDSPVDVEKVVEALREWQPDLVTMVHCDTPTGALNSEAVRFVGEACSKTQALFYVDVVSSAGAVPVDISGWNIDIGLLGSQKAFSLEPSLGIVTVSAKAWKQIEKVNYGGYDALLPFKSFQKSGVFPYTPLWSALDAMQFQFKTIYGPNSEFAENVYKRHADVAQYCRDRVRKMGLKLWWDKEYEALNSASVTAIRVPENTTWEALDQKLRKEGVIFGGSYGQTANALFRIGHMGTQADLKTVTYALDVLEKVISQK